LPPITSADLDHSKSTYAEFISLYTLAIGCSDGSIRVWDCLRRKITKIWDKTNEQTQARGEIVLLKNLSDTYPPLMRNIGGKPLVRFLSLAQDGQLLIWEPRIEGSLVIGDGPKARLEDGSNSDQGSGPCKIAILASGGNSSVLLSRDVSGPTLTLACADRSLRTWRLDLLNSGQGQGASLKSDQGASLGPGNQGSAPASTRTRASWVFSSVSDQGSALVRLPCLRRIKATPGKTSSG
jgi:WD40 repeat protein